MMIWRCGWRLSCWLQVCNTLKKPISAPRCLGSRATSRRVSALVRNKRPLENLFVVQYQRGQTAREGEDHVQVPRGERFSSTCGNPPFASSGLTLRAVAITATVIRDGGAMCAAGALIEMSAEWGRTTA